MNTDSLKLQILLRGLSGNPSRPQFNRQTDAERYIRASSLNLHLTTVWFIDLDDLKNSKSAGWTFTLIENVH